MKRSCSIVICLLVSVLCSLTTVFALEPVTVIPPEGDYWTGAKIPLSIELRAQGSFSGTATFQFPELPQTTLMSLGNPVVRSESGAEGEVFVQRHNFALYTQQDGTLTFPEVSVHFSVKQGEKVEAVTANTPGFEVTIKRPPGVSSGRLVVSSLRYEVTQTWTPEVDEAELGMVITRTVTQTAGDISGMALPPLPRRAPEGVRTYPPEVTVADQVARGALQGKREETLRYRLEGSGEVTLPSVRYQWWNPRTEKLEVQVVDGRKVKVKGPLFGDAKSRQTWKWRGVVILSMIVGVFALFRYKSQWMKYFPRKKHLPPLNPLSR